MALIEAIEIAEVSETAILDVSSNEDVLIQRLPDLRLQEVVGKSTSFLGITTHLSEEGEPSWWFQASIIFCERREFPW